MKELLFWLAAASLAQAALAQDVDAPAAAERARIAAERSQVEASFRTQEKDCYGKFAVNDCLSAARARRREAISDLRRQEISLNDADRKRKGAERQRAIEERPAPENKPARVEQPAKGSADHREPGTRAAQQAAERAQAQSANAASARERQRQAQLKASEKNAERIRRAEETAQKAQHQKEQQAEAEEHRASVKKRLAERKNPPAAPLPVPP
jgi:colicin import membrane protein